ncbi:MAG: tRNA 2-thiocytidine biosynthesis TtcA family protein [Lachnospiraceae bacterium]|nr:tRNA 2-thiocytidine biosynthesis TtcA family protein [Lachnospiraceae bacterium]
MEEKKDAVPRHSEIEKSIIKRYRKSIWRPFVRALNEYDMIKEGDHIAVCISGGKDSMLLAKCMQEIRKHGKMQFELTFLVMDPGYNAANRRKIEENARILDIPVHIFDTDIFNAVEDIKDSPCYLCARMRRGYLYKEARRLGCNKIALGHHFDDVIETILMGMLYGAQIQTMMPKLHSTNHPGMQLIRPLYLVKEDAVIKWAQFNELEFIQCACRFTEMYTETKNANGESKREEMKELIAHFRGISDHIEGNIFKSVENVNLNTIISYKKDGAVHHFLDDYDERGKGFINNL